jgi:hypothetical protein
VEYLAHVGVNKLERSSPRFKKAGTILNVLKRISNRSSYRKLAAFSKLESDTAHFIFFVTYEWATIS